MDNKDIIEKNYNLSENTIRKYTQKVNYLIDQYGFTDSSNFDYIMHILKEFSENNKKSYLNTIIWYFRSKHDNKYNNIIIKLSSTINRIAIKTNNETEIKKENKKLFLTNFDMKNKILAEWEKIKEKYKEIEKDKDFSQVKYVRYVIFSILLYNPPRLNEDYYLMCIVNNLNEINNNEVNYYVRNKKTFIFNVFKTSKSYGQQRIQVSDKLYTILEKYINKYDIQGSLLGMTEEVYNKVLPSIFKNSNVQVYNNSINKMVKNIMNITAFRDIYVIAMFYKGKLNTIEDRILYDKLMCYNIIDFLENA